MATVLHHPDSKFPVSEIKTRLEHRKMTFGTLIMAGIMGGASLLLVSVPDPTARFGPDEKLIAVCLSGGIAGGLVAIIMFPLTKIKQTAMKWLASSVAAGVFSPAVCKYYGIESDISQCLFLSGIVGLTAWAVLLATIPLVSIIAKWFVRKTVPGAFDPADGGLPRERYRPDWVSAPMPMQDQVQREEEELQRKKK